MTDMEPFDEFLEDFGARPLSDAELDGLLERTRGLVDGELRLAIKQLQALRWLSGVLLERIEDADHEVNDPIIKTARFMVRGEGAIGSARV